MSCSSDSDLYNAKTEELVIGMINDLEITEDNPILSTNVEQSQLENFSPTTNDIWQSIFPEVVENINSRGSPWSTNSDSTENQSIDNASLSLIWANTTFDDKYYPQPSCTKKLNTDLLETMNRQEDVPNEACGDVVTPKPMPGSVNANKRYLQEVKEAIYGSTKEHPPQNSKDYHRAAEEYCLYGKHFFDFPETSQDILNNIYKSDESSTNESIRSDNNTPIETTSKDPQPQDHLDSQSSAKDTNQQCVKSVQTSGATEVTGMNAGATAKGYVDPTAMTTVMDKSADIVTVSNAMPTSGFPVTTASSFLASVINASTASNLMPNLPAITTAPYVLPPPPPPPGTPQGYTNLQSLSTLLAIQAQQILNTTYKEVQAICNGTIVTASANNSNNNNNNNNNINNMNLLYSQLFQQQLNLQAQQQYAALLSIAQQKQRAAAAAGVSISIPLSNSSASTSSSSSSSSGSSTSSSSYNAYNNNGRMSTITNSLPVIRNRYVRPPLLALPTQALNGMNLQSVELAPQVNQPTANNQNLGDLPEARPS